MDEGDGWSNDFDFVRIVNVTVALIRTKLNHDIIFFKYFK